MRFRTLQWNIQAARVLEEGKDPKKSESYSGDNPEYFANVINEYDPDVVALQELHQNSERSQLAEIAKLTGLNHAVYDKYEKKSFLSPNYEMGQGMLSKHEFLNHMYRTIDYSKFSDTDDSGTVYRSRDMGMSTAEIKVYGVAITLATVHSPSFGAYKLTEESKEARSLHDAFDSLFLTLGKNWIFIGDLNIKSQSLKGFMPRTLGQPGVDEVIHTTTVPKGFVLDHVMYRNVELANARVDTSVLADHYLLVTDFELYN